MAHQFALAKNGLSRIIASVLPCSCALCGGIDRDIVCAACAEHYVGASRGRCRQCALPVAACDDVPRCGACLRDPPHFDATIAAVDYAPPVDQLVLGLKFGGTLALASFMARTIQTRLTGREPADLPSVLLPVPLAAARLSERGFNQAMEIARSLARSQGIGVEPRLLRRIRETGTQSLLPPEERRQNVRNAFALSADRADAVRGRHIGIVDDVMTTGETLNAIAAVLKRSGAARVTNLVFARTVPR